MKTIRRVIIMLLSMAFLGAGIGSAAAEMLVHPAGYGTSERFEITESDKEHYLSRGQEFLREYMREQVLRFAADHGVPLQEYDYRPGASLDVSRWLHRDDARLQTRFRVLADEDLQKYFQGDGLWPVWMEVESSFRANDAWKLGVLMRAPLDDLLTMEFSSRLRLSETIETRLQWRLKNTGNVYDGLDVGLGWRWSAWCLTWDCGLTEDFRQRQRLSIARFF